MRNWLSDRLDDIAQGYAIKAGYEVKSVNMVG